MRSLSVNSRQPRLLPIHRRYLNHRLSIYCWLGPSDWPSSVGGNLTSVESDRCWYDLVKARIKDTGLTNVGVSDTAIFIKRKMAEE